MFGGLALARIGQHRKPLVQIAAPLLVLAQVALMWHSPRVAVEYLRLTRQSNEAMAPILAATPDPIASEDMGLLVTNDKLLGAWSGESGSARLVYRWPQVGRIVTDIQPFLRALLLELKID